VLLTWPAASVGAREGGAGEWGEGRRGVWRDWTDHRYSYWIVRVGCVSSAGLGHSGSDAWLRQCVRSWADGDGALSVWVLGSLDCVLCVTAHWSFPLSGCA